MMAYVYYGMYILLAIIFSISVVMALGGGLHIANKHGGRFLITALFMIAILVAVSTVLGGRNLTLVGDSIENLYADGGGEGGAVFSKLSTYLMLGLIIALLCDRVAVRFFYRNRDRFRSGWLCLFVVYIFSNGIVSAFLGSHPAFTPGLLYPLIILMALAMDNRWSLREVIGAIRLSLLVFLAAGLLVLLLKPSLVLERGGGQSLFLPFRFWGLAPHANALGSITVLYFLLEFMLPTPSNALRRFGLFCGFVSLVLAQSKTSIMGMLLCVACIWMFRHSANEFSNESDYRAHVLGRVFVAICGLSVLLVLLAVGGGYEKLDKLFYRLDSHSSLTTLSGRTMIWEAALREWAENPLFGYGPNLFGLEHRMQLGMLFAFHAHNQFIQTIAQSGLIGLCGLILFMVVLCSKLLWRVSETNGVSLALVAFLLIRCLTEVPLRSGNMISGEYIYLVVLVAIAMTPRKLLKAELGMRPVEHA